MNSPENNFERTQIGILSDLLSETLSEDIKDHNGFVDIALTGESLRRAVLAVPSKPHKDVENLLKDYDKFLKDYSGEAPDIQFLSESLSEAVTNFGREADSVENLDDVDDLEDALMGIDEIAAIVAALNRAGRVDDNTVLEFGNKIIEMITPLFPKLSMLYDFAYSHNRNNNGGESDRDHETNLYLFWGLLAELSDEAKSDNEEYERNKFSEEVRRRLINGAVNRLSE